MWLAVSFLVNKRSEEKAYIMNYSVDATRGCFNSFQILPKVLHLIVVTQNDQLYRDMLFWIFLFLYKHNFFFYYYHFQDMLHFVDYAWIPLCFLLCILHAICSKIVGSSNEFSQILFLFINLWRTFPWRLVSYGRYRSDLYLEFPRQSPLSFKTR